MERARPGNTGKQKEKSKKGGNRRRKNDIARLLFRGPQKSRPISSFVPDSEERFRTRNVRMTRPPRRCKAVEVRDNAKKSRRRKGSLAVVGSRYCSNAERGVFSYSRDGKRPFQWLPIPPLRTEEKKFTLTQFPIPYCEHLSVPSPGSGPSLRKLREGNARVRERSAVVVPFAVLAGKEEKRRRRTKENSAHEREEEVSPGLGRTGRPQLFQSGEECWVYFDQSLENIFLSL